MKTKTSTALNVQINFTADPALKKKALKRAKSEGITLKAMLVMAMKSYANNELTLSLRPKENYYDELFADKEIVTKANEFGKLLDKVDL